jgi:hypothetical protein
VTDWRLFAGDQQPVATFPVPIQQHHGAVEVRVSVFDGGDVYVEFGHLTQWFPFPAGEPRPAAPFSFMPVAVARELVNLRGFGRYEQRDRVEDQRLVRERHWENGVIETLTLNPRTGDIVSRGTRQPVTPVNRHRPLSPPPSALGQAVASLASIDLDLLRAGPGPSPADPSPGGITSTCSTPHGACTLLMPARTRSACSCYGPFGTVEGVAR